MRLGLTGGIGSGKSLAVSIWRRMQRPVIEADEIARQIVQPGSSVLAQIVDCFGPNSLLSTGALNRPWLRNLIFTDAASRKKLEAIMHPCIRQHILAAFRDLVAEPLIILSSPLLLETGQDSLVDRIVVVDVTEDVQLKRALQRDQTSRQQMKQIMAAQYTRAKRLEKADFLLDNHTTVRHLYRQIRSLDKKLMHKIQDAVKPS